MNDLVRWRKSSYSTDHGECIEVGSLLVGAWAKSSYSADQGECVEVAPFASLIGVRDSKDPSRGNLAVPHPSWSALLAAVEMTTAT